MQFSIVDVDSVSFFSSVNHYPREFYIRSKKKKTLTNWVQHILGDPGAVNWAGRKGATKAFSSTGGKASGYRLSGAFPPVLENFRRAFPPGRTDRPWVPLQLLVSEDETIHNRFQTRPLKAILVFRPSFQAEIMLSLSDQPRKNKNYSNPFRIDNSHIFLSF